MPIEESQHSLAMFRTLIQCLQTDYRLQVRSSSQVQTTPDTSSTTTTTATTTTTPKDTVVKGTLSNAGVINARSSLQSVSHRNETGEVEDILEVSGIRTLSSAKLLCWIESCMPYRRPVRCSVE
ncbi:unnamed protein product [Cylicocyclus nassatus]|uniref:Uncharacterized protein n=1 Tax=Cylicocyclus nassatus TaxID=53992 RepID=A0AA36HGS8_CYLNA|nr:unnamed protein product [Cylicocyclus nassatus]